MKKNLVLVSWLLLAVAGSTGLVSAQVWEEWVARYNGPGNSTDEALAMALDAFGNVYVTGLSSGMDTHFDYATVKYGSAGNQLWVARYNGPGNGGDIARAVAVDAGGNVYVTGSSWSMDTGADYATVKYDAEGNELWVARYHGPGNGDDWARAMVLDAAGNVYVTGWSLGAGTFADYATVKYDSEGNELWVARYHGPGNGFDEAAAMTLDADGNVYVTGWSQGVGTFEDYATVKYDSEGNELWVARYNGPGNGGDIARAVALDADGNVYVTGDSCGVRRFPDCLDYATVKYDADGNQLWVARYNGPENSWDVATAMTLDADGNVYVTGGSRGGGTDLDYATVKYDSEGNELWVARYHGPGNSRDVATAVALDAAGNVYVTGGSEGTGSDYATIKYDFAGNQLWVARYNGPGNSFDEATAMALDADGNVYVTGRSAAGGRTWLDYATIKYAQK